MDANFVQGRKMFEARLMMRAMEDDAFRELLLKNPRAAVEQEMGKPLPASFKVSVVEEPNDTLVLVVPPKASPGGEMSDAELEAVAGAGWYRDLKEWLGYKYSSGTLTGTAVAGVRG